MLRFYCLMFKFVPQVVTQLHIAHSYYNDLSIAYLIKQGAVWGKISARMLPVLASPLTHTLWPQEAGGGQRLIFFNKRVINIACYNTSEQPADMGGIVYPARQAH